MIRVGYLTRKKSIFTERVGVLWEIGRDEPSPSAAHLEAFRTAERARARALLDALAGADLDPGATVPPALGDRQRQLARRINALQTQLSQAASAESGLPYTRSSNG